MTAHEECVVPHWMPPSLRQSYRSSAKILGEEEAASLIRARKRRISAEPPEGDATSGRREDPSKLGNNT